MAVNVNCSCSLVDKVQVFDKSRPSCMCWQNLLLCNRFEAGAGDGGRLQHADEGLSAERLAVGDGTGANPPLARRNICAP